MALAPDPQGLPRYEETDIGTTGTFASLLNRALQWVSDVLAPMGGRMTRTTQLTNGVSAAVKAASMEGASELTGMSWSSAQPTRLVAALKGGRLLVRVRITMGSTATATAWIRINGSAARETTRYTAANASGAVTLVFVETISIAAGEYLELMTQSNGDWPIISADVSVDRISSRIV